MSDKIARVCDYCGGADIIGGDYDSNGMVQPYGTHLLLMVPIKKGKGSRPTFALSGKHWHPACLIKALQEWFDKEVNHG